MAARDDLALWARYPFLAAARGYVRGEGYSVGDLVRDPAYERARRRAVERLKGALAGGGIPDAPAGTDVDAELELLSYPLARLLLGQLGDSYLGSRYAVAESKLTSLRLADETSPDLVWRIAQELGVALEPPREGAGFARLHFLDYLRYAPTRDSQWKLVNQPLRNGFVSLSRERAIRISEEALRDRLIEEFDGMERPGSEILTAFSRDLNELTTLLMAHRARFQEEATGEVRVDAFPPCMKAIWSGIQNHVNVPHMGRFAIVSFLHKLGMDSESILKFFSAVPDFDVNKSRYQIEHITGKIGGSTEYTPPNCSTMQTYGICPLEERDEICLTMIHHPLSYYRKKLRYLGPSKAPPARPVPTPAASPEAPHAG